MGNGMNVADAIEATNIGKIQGNISYTCLDTPNVGCDFFGNGLDIDDIDKENAPGSGRTNREMAHALLDEWFDKSKSTGSFTVRNKFLRVEERPHNKVGVKVR